MLARRAWSTYIQVLKTTTSDFFKKAWRDQHNSATQKQLESHVQTFYITIDSFSVDLHPRGRRQRWIREGLSPACALGHGAISDEGRGGQRADFALGTRQLWAYDSYSLTEVGYALLHNMKRCT